MNLCFELEELECTENWGTYQGDGVPCDPNPCPTSDVVAGGEGPHLFMIVGPNPSTGPVTITYGLPVAGRVSIDLFDASGRRIRQVHAGTESAGAHVISWDATDDAGRQVPSGIYFVRLVGGSGVVTKPVLLAR
jgi:hypothetical protein